MKSKKIIIGSRGSKLALIYAERACSKILEISSDFKIEGAELLMYQNLFLGRLKKFNDLNNLS